MLQFIVSLGVFVVILGVWAVFALAVVTLASFLPGDQLVSIVGGGVSLLGLIAALGVAARLVGRLLALIASPAPDPRE